MSEFYAVRKGNALYPADAESAAEFNKLPNNKPVKIDATRSRNIDRLRLYWVFCTRIGNALGQEREVISDVLKIATGHCVTVKTRSGWQRLPRSIAFGAMEETDFGKFFDRCIIAVCEELGMKRPDVLDAVSDIIDGGLPWNKAVA
jgi:hypothetical protein